MTVSLKTDLRLPITGQQGHGSRNIHAGLPSGLSDRERCTPIRDNYDLMTLVGIRLEEKVYNGDAEDEGYELFDFLNLIMYPHNKDFIRNMSKYIDFSDNEELWKEANTMSGLGQSILEEGIEQGISKFIELCQEFGVPREEALRKVISKFSVPEEVALQSLDKYWE